MCSQVPGCIWFSFLHPYVISVNVHRCQQGRQRTVQGTQWECPQSESWEVSAWLDFMFSLDCTVLSRLMTNGKWPILQPILFFLILLSKGGKFTKYVRISPTFPLHCRAANLFLFYTVNSQRSKALQTLKLIAACSTVHGKSVWSCFSSLLPASSIPGQYHLAPVLRSLSQVSKHERSRNWMAGTDKKMVQKIGRMGKYMSDSRKVTGTLMKLGKAQALIKHSPMESGSQFIISVY